MEFDSRAAKLVNLVIILAQLVSSSVALPAQLVLVVTVDIIIAVGMIIGVAVGRHSGSPLAMTTMFTILFSTVPLFFCHNLF